MTQADLEASHARQERLKDAASKMPCVQDASEYATLAKDCLADLKPAIDKAASAENIAENPHRHSTPRFRIPLLPAPTALCIPAALKARTCAPSAPGQRLRRRGLAPQSQDPSEWRLSFGSKSSILPSLPRKSFCGNRRFCIESALRLHSLFRPHPA